MEINEILRTNLNGTRMVETFLTFFFGSLKRVGSGKLCFVALSISGVC